MCDSQFHFFFIFGFFSLLHDLMNRELLFAQDYSLENSDGSYLCFPLDSLHSVPFFSLYFFSSSTVYTLSDTVSSNIDKVLSVNPSADVFVFKARFPLGDK